MTVRCLKRKYHSISGALVRTVVVRIFSCASESSARPFAINVVCWKCCRTDVDATGIHILYDGGMNEADFFSRFCIIGSKACTRTCYYLPDISLSGLNDIKPVLCLNEFNQHYPLWDLKAWCVSVRSRSYAICERMFVRETLPSSGRRREQ